MSSILVFDVETTGFVSLNHPHTSPTNGRIIQFACGLYDYDFNEVQFFHSLIAIPNEQEVVMNDAAFDCHGITLERARLHGCMMEQALMIFQLMLSVSSLQVAHNINFDLRAINNEERFFPQMPPTTTSNRLCTMMAMTKHCDLSKVNGQPKAPKCIEAFKFVTGKDDYIYDKHDAVHEVRMTKTILRWLVDNGHYQLPPVIHDVPSEEISHD